MSDPQQQPQADQSTEPIEAADQPDSPTSQTAASEDPPVANTAQQPAEHDTADTADTHAQAPPAAETAPPAPAATPPPDTTRLWLSVGMVLVAFVLGMLVGFVGSDLVAPQAAEQQTAQDDTPAEPAAAAPEAGDSAAESAGTAAPAEEATPETAMPTAETPAEAPSGRAPTNDERQELMNLLIEQTRHFRGDPDAPITMIEFSDFQCPYCGRYTVETAPQIVEAYVDEGLVRMGFYPLAFLGEQSLWAAEASECAAAQDAFWDYHTFLYERLAIEGQRDFSRENLKRFAEEIELDAEAFATCMDEERYAEVIMNDTGMAQSVGVQSTPTFLINGWAIIGAQPYDNFALTIDEILAELDEETGS